MSVESFIREYSLSLGEDEYQARFCGAFSFDRRTVNKDELLYALCKLRHSVEGVIDEAVKELQEIK